MFAYEWRMDVMRACPCACAWFSRLGVCAWSLLGRYGRSSGRDESAYLARQLESWEGVGGGVWVGPDGGLGDDFDGMGVASWDGGAWNDDGA